MTTETEPSRIYRENPFSTRTINYEADMHELLGSNEISIDQVPAELLGEFERLHGDSETRDAQDIINELVRFEKMREASVESGDEDISQKNYIKGVLNSFYRSMDKSEFDPIKNGNTQSVELVNRDQLIEFQAHVEADLIRIESGVIPDTYELLDDPFAYVVGRNRGITWVLGRTDDLPTDFLGPDQIESKSS